MNRLVVLTLVLVLTVGVPASGLLAAGPMQMQNQAQTGDCVCDGPNCDCDCPQNCYQKQSGYSYQGEVPENDWGMFMFQYYFGGEG